MAHPNQLRTADGVVHAPGFTTALACTGRIASSQYEIANDAIVTCLWCIAGTQEPDLRWFKWGDGK
jgi:hypothetical protein